MNDASTAKLSCYLTANRVFQAAAVISVLANAFLAWRIGRRSEELWAVDVRAGELGVRLVVFSAAAVAADGARSFNFWRVKLVAGLKRLASVVTLCCVARLQRRTVETATTVIMKRFKVKPKPLTRMGSICLLRSRACIRILRSVWVG